jgi:hypothetical protein
MDKRKVVLKLAACCFVLSTVAVVLIADKLWTGGEYANDHGTSGYPGAGIWFGFLGAVLISLVSLSSIVVLIEQGRRN